MIVKKHFGSVDKGKIIWDDLKSLKTDVYQHEGKKVEVTIKRKRKVRSSDQNSYYHGVVVKLLSEHIGYTPDEMHEAIKYKFLLKKTKGKPTTIGSTATLTTTEFEKLMTKIREWSSIELGVYIPEPNEVEWEY